MVLLASLKQLLMSYSLARPRLVSVRILWRRVELRKPLVVVETLKTTTYKHDSIVCDDEILACLQEIASHALNDINNNQTICNYGQLSSYRCLLKYT